MADTRKLKDQAADAVAKGRYRLAAELYEQVAAAEPIDPQWPHRAGEAWKRVGDRIAAVTQLTAAAEGYAKGGFFLKAISVVKMILEIDPGRTEAQTLLAGLYARREERGTEGLGGRHPTAPSLLPVPAANRSPQAPSAPELPVREQPPAPPEEPATLLDEPAPARGARASHPGTPAARRSSGDFAIEVDPHDVVPIDEAIAAARASSPALHEPPTPPVPPPAVAGDVEPPDEVFEMALSERVPGSRISQEFTMPAFEIPLASHTPLPTAVPGMPGGLPRIPLFSSLDEQRLNRLIEGSQIIRFSPGQEIVRQGERGEALYVVVHGRVAVRVDGVAEPVAHLGDGEFFGELALLSDQPRLASVEAVSEVELLAIGREIVWQLIDESPDVLGILLRFFRDRLIERLIQTSPLFASFSGHESRELAERFHFLELKAGAELVREGQRAEGLFVILLGRCNVITRAGGVVATLGPGDLAGEISLLNHGPATASVVAASPLWALGLPRAGFQELILTHPQILIYVNDVAEQRRARDSRRVRMV